MEAKLTAINAYTLHYMNNIMPPSIFICEKNVSNQSHIIEREFRFMSYSVEIFLKFVSRAMQSARYTAPTGNKINISNIEFN
jgi:hypothetical protein